MDYNEYKQMVIDSEKGSLTKYPKILHAIMGMNGEAGECVDILKKHMFQGHELDVDHLLNELGDVCWYTMLLIVESGIEASMILEYVDRIVHVKPWKEETIDMGLSYVLGLNKDCGYIIDIYYSSIGNPGSRLYGTLRNIFYNIIKAANMFDKTLEDVFDINYEKIKKRYPEGFETDKSINRNETVESTTSGFKIYDSNGESKGRIYYER